MDSAKRWATDAERCGAGLRVDGRTHRRELQFSPKVDVSSVRDRDVGLDRYRKSRGRPLQIVVTASGMTPTGTGGDFGRLKLGN